MRRILTGWLCVMLPGAVLAAGSHGAHRQVQASTRLGGWVEVASTGKVAHYDLDQSSALPPAVVKLIAQSVPHWQFKLAETGDPPTTTLRARMNLRIVATPLEDHQYRLGIASAEFDTADAQGTPDTDRITAKRLPPPDYPKIAARAHCR